MENQIYEGKTVYDFFYYLLGALQILGFIIIIFISYYIIKLYRKLIKFLDKNS